MWLLPLLDRVSGFAGRTYYRLTIAGERVPPGGPVLLVANHPNSLFDPALVAAAARRPVRFLAKEPLLRDPAVGWLVRGAGAIPVYRAQDDPSAMGRNEEAFRAAHEALRQGAAIGIFPEGISHDLPNMAPLKTGAARIALGAAGLLGGAFPIMPVGLTFRGKEQFRSECLVLVGSPLEWQDLAGPDGGPDEVRELTARIGAALQAQTLNLHSWEDAPLVRWAAAIYAAHFDAPAGPDGLLLAEREAQLVLARERAQGSGDWEQVAREVRRHARVLRAFGLRPTDLPALPGGRVAARWTLRNAGWLLLTGAVGALGGLLFYLPYRLTGSIVDRLDLTPDVRSTYRALGGALFFSLWILLLSAAAGLLLGWWWALAALVALPVLALFTSAFRDRLYQAVSVARRFLLLRTRQRLREELHEQQRGIAERLKALRERVPSGQNSRTTR
jgi:glycerol-3-phosphate O-acyltransferase / dihydroxyacetone phosphate acyltransferase